MISKVAAAVVLGLSVRGLMEFVTRMREVDEFGRMSITDAADMVNHNLGTVAQHERMLQLSIMQLHAASDAAQLRKGRDLKSTEDPGQFL
jgi:hypothetical protein